MAVFKIEEKNGTEVHIVDAPSKARAIAEIAGQRYEATTLKASEVLKYAQSNANIIVVGKAEREAA